MKQKQTVFLFLLVAMVLQQTIETEGVFFFDLLCYSRLDALEKQVAQLNAYLNTYRQPATSSNQVQTQATGNLINARRRF